MHASAPCTHPRHGPFAKIGMPCGFYKHLHQEPIGRKNAKKRAKRIQEQQDCACGAVSTDTQQVSKPEEEATQKALEATIAKLEMELAELKAKQ
jgi:uncharacterized protein YceH (UPF0502 family)